MTRLETQQDWDVGKLHGRWPSGPDNVFMLDRLNEVTVGVTAADAPGSGRTSPTNR